jgi:hypothetical protein
LPVNSLVGPAASEEKHNNLKTTLQINPLLSQKLNIHDRKTKFKK